MKTLVKIGLWWTAASVALAASWAIFRRIQKPPLVLARHPETGYLLPSYPWQ